MSDRIIDWIFRATDKTGAAFRSVDSKLAGITKSLRTFAGFTGFAALAGGIGTLTKDLVELGSELQDASEKLGITAEVLQGLKLGAEETGSSFDQLQRAAVFLTKLTGNAVAGNSAAELSFDRLGLSVDAFAQLSVDRRLSVLAEVIQGAETPAEALELALIGLGKGAADLVPLFKGGEEALAAYQKKADEAGIITSAQSEILEKAGDDWGRFWNSVKVGAVPALTSVLEFFRNAKNEFDKFREYVLNNQIPLPGVDRRFQGRPPESKPDNRGLSLAESATFTTPNVLKAGEEAAAAAKKAAEAAAKAAAKAAAAGAKFLADEAAKTAKEIESVTADIAKLSKEANSYFEDRGKELTEKYKPAIDILADGVDEVNRLFIAGVISSETAAAAIKDYSASYIDSFDKVIEKNTEVSDSTTDLLKEIQVAANGFARDLTDTFFDATQTIGELFEQLAITIAKAIFTQTVTEPLIKSILGSINFSGLGSSTGGTSSGGNAPESFFRRAIGGSVMAGSSYLVGERGPELFVPSGGGTIVPNGGSSPVTVNFTITSVDPQTAAQTIASQERLITGMIRRATLRAGRRPQLA